MQIALAHKTSGQAFVEQSVLLQVGPSGRIDKGFLRQLAILR